MSDTTSDPRASGAPATPDIDLKTMAQPTVNAMVTLMRHASINGAPEYWASEWTAALVSFGEMILKQSAVPGAAAVSREENSETHSPDGDGLFQRKHQSGPISSSEGDVIGTNAGQRASITGAGSNPAESHPQQPAAVSPLALEEPKVLEAIDKVLEGFDIGVFHRNVSHDDAPGWAIKLLPYISALAVLARLRAGRHE